LHPETCAVLACYGWVDVDPEHGFHQNERSQIHCTISPGSCRKMLRRLLDLNLETAAAESAPEA